MSRIEKAFASADVKVRKTTYSYTHGPSHTCISDVSFNINTPDLATENPYAVILSVATKEAEKEVERLSYEILRVTNEL